GGGVNKDHGIAADAGHVRIDHTQHRLRGNGGVECIAARAKDLRGGLRRLGLARRHGVGVTADDRSSRVWKTHRFRRLISYDPSQRRRVILYAASYRAATKKKGTC